MFSHYCPRCPCIQDGRRTLLPHVPHNQDIDTGLSVVLRCVSSSFSLYYSH